MARVEKIPAGRSPRLSIPSARVQRKASLPETEALFPTTAVPSAEIPAPLLR